MTRHAPPKTNPHHLLADWIHRSTPKTCMCRLSQSRKIDESALHPSELRAHALLLQFYCFLSQVVRVLSHEGTQPGLINPGH